MINKNGSKQTRKSSGLGLSIWLSIGKGEIEKVAKCKEVKKLESGVNYI
jgi:hypothetical protein